MVTKTCMIVTGCDPVSHKFHVHACYSPSFMCETCMLYMHVLGTCIYNMHVSGNQYECHTHSKIAYASCMHAPCIFSKKKKNDAAMHQ